MSPLYVCRCLFCGYESEHYAPTHERMESQLANYECQKCACKGYEKVPQRTAWKFGESMKGK